MLFFIILSALKVEGQNEFIYKENAVASFTMGDQKFDIWASISNNPSKPTLWQFRYQPLFIPVFDNNGVIFSSSYKIGNKLRVKFQLILDSSWAVSEAYKQLKLAYPNEDVKISMKNISSINLKSISFTLPDLATISSTAKIVNSTIKSGLTGKRRIFVEIEDDNETKIKIIKDQLPNTNLYYSVSLDVIRATQNNVFISFKKLKTSKLYTDLKKLPGGTEIKYIQIDDLRKLCENILQEISIDGIIADRSEFKEDIIITILDKWSSASITNSFDSLKYSSTFNAEDLKPDILTKAFDKVFDHIEGTTHYIHKNNTEIGIKAGGLFGLVNTEANVKTEWSEDELKTLMTKHDIEASFEGYKITVKSVKVKQVNISDFESNNNFTETMTFIKDRGLQSIDDQTPLFISEVSDNVSQNNGVPIGSIISFAGEVTKIPKGWFLCDGTVLNKREYTDLFDKIGTCWGSNNIDQFNLPDLRGKFLRGVDYGANLDSDTIRKIGSDQSWTTGIPKNIFRTDTLGEHNHTISSMGMPSFGGLGARLDGPYTRANLDTRFLLLDVVGFGNIYPNGLVVSGKHSHNILGGDLETRPVNAAVNYIIKWK